MTRDKMIYRLFAIPVNENIIILHPLASAGTYIKEFVHSDLGRTQPNVASLVDEGRKKRLDDSEKSEQKPAPFESVGEVDILQLDVMEVYDSIDKVEVEGEATKVFNV